jgi:SAM-dependent methyltransferase
VATLDRERRLRLAEAAGVMELLPAGCRLLEIGAGGGWQARFFAERGHAVTAVDVGAGRFADHLEFPVTSYDGRVLPFGEASFDAVYSSNVLEHVPHVEALLGETRRVLRRGGLAVHVVPSATWRLWTTLAQPLAMLRLVAGGGAAAAGRRVGPATPAWRKLRLALLPSRHGEHGGAWSELALFSRFRWRRLFRRAGFEVARDRSLGLFYTPWGFGGEWLTLPARRRLAALLGSSSRVYVLRPAGRAGGA